MRKQLSITFALLCAVACKTESATATKTGSADEPAAKVRSAKIDVKPIAPPQPTAPPSLPVGEVTADDRAHADPNARQDFRSRRNARIDTDGDGVISDEERDAAMRERMAAMRARLDADGDGKLTPAELGAARGRMHFDDPAAVDTNHDGEISPDELGAAMRARREQRMAQRPGGGPAGPAAGAGGSAAPGQ